MNEAKRIFDSLSWLTENLDRLKETEKLAALMMFAEFDEALFEFVEELKERYTPSRFTALWIPTDEGDDE